MTNYDRIRSMKVEEMAEFLTSLLDGENNHNVGCYGCVHYGTFHSEPRNKGNMLYECEDCPSEGIGYNLIKWLQQEANYEEQTH